MNIRLDLPHTVYVLPKQSAAKGDIAVSALGPAADKGFLSFQVSNNGPWFGRALSTELPGNGHVVQGSGFPLYPHSVRIIEVPCRANQVPTTVRLRFKKFKLDAPVAGPGEDQACTL